MADRLSPRARAPLDVVPSSSVGTAGGATVTPMAVLVLLSGRLVALASGQPTGDS